MDLKEYLDGRGIRYNFIAKALDISPAYLSNIMNRKKIPNLKLATQIERLTKGKVKVNSFLEKKEVEVKEEKD